MKKNIFILLFLLLIIEHLLTPWLAPLLTLYACIIGQITNGQSTIRTILLMGILEDIFQVTYPPGTYTTIFIAIYCLIELIKQISSIRVFILTMIILIISGLITNITPALFTFGVEDNGIFLANLIAAIDASLLLLPYLIVSELFVLNDLRSQP